MSDESDFEQGATYQGIVIEFDEHVGLGVIQTATGETLPFHCVNISDGTRKIDIDSEVTFVTKWHPRGRMEATTVEVVRHS